jgi:hypothetical protein
MKITFRSKDHEDEALFLLYYCALVLANCDGDFALSMPTGPPACKNFINAQNAADRFISAIPRAKSFAGAVEVKFIHFSHYKTEWSKQL